MTPVSEAQALTKWPWNWGLGHAGGFRGEVPALVLRISDAIEQRSPTFLALGTSFMEDNFSTDRDGGWFWDDSSTLHLLCTLFLSFINVLKLFMYLFIYLFIYVFIYLLAAISLRCWAGFSLWWLLLL